MSEALMVLTSFAGGMGELYSGISSNASARETAKLQEEQARIALEESKQEVEAKVQERRKFLAQQRVDYLASGVSLIGTPGIVQSDTFYEYQKEIDALRKSGAASYALGIRKAAAIRSSGRAALISGILSGISTTGKGIYKSGIFDKKTKEEK